jgi:DNA topoisomerase-6 subunit A
VSARRRRRRPAPSSRAELDQVAIDSIENVARQVHRTIKSYEKPSLSFPIRSLSNVSYDKDVGYFEIGNATSQRTLTVNTAKSFAQTLLMMQLSRTHIRTDERATRREAYYISKNWGDARFDEQTESDTVLDDIEAMFSTRGISREQLRFIAEQHGGSVVGPLVVIENDPESGEDVHTDCSRFVSGSFTIPKDVEGLRFESDAKFVLCIETGGAFHRLQHAKFWRSHKCILVDMGGVPSRACRRFVRRLADDLNLKVYAFTDCDPYGFANIYRTLKVGSGNAAHINRFYCVPQARFLGVTPEDIEKYDLPTHPMQEVDIKRAKDALKNDPFFSSHRPWVKSIKRLIEKGYRAEQQAFAKHGLQFVYETYLPEKLANAKKFLP